MRQLVKPGGRVAFLEPNPLNPLYYIQMAVMPGMSWEGDGGIVRMRPRRVLGAMQAAGLTPRRRQPLRVSAAVRCEHAPGRGCGAHARARAALAGCAPLPALRRARPRRPGVTSVRRAGAVVLLGAVSLYLTAGRGVSPGDESWFLLVAKRVADGDDLYRDVFYSPLPLAVYVTAAPVALFGAHIAIVEVLIALTWACTALVVVGYTLRVTGSRAVAGLTLMALVVAAPPQRNSLYTPLAMLLLLVCMLLATRLLKPVGPFRASSPVRWQGSRLPPSRRSEPARSRRCCSVWCSRRAPAGRGRSWRRSVGLPPSQRSRARPRAVRSAGRRRPDGLHRQG